MSFVLCLKLYVKFNLMYVKRYFLFTRFHILRCFTIGLYFKVMQMAQVYQNNQTCTNLFIIQITDCCLVEI